MMEPMRSGGGYGGGEGLQDCNEIRLRAKNVKVFDSVDLFC